MTYSICRLNAWLPGVQSSHVQRRRTHFIFRKFLHLSALLRRVEGRTLQGIFRETNTHQNLFSSSCVMAGKLKGTIVIEHSVDENPHTGMRHVFIDAIKETFEEVVTMEEVRKNPEIGERVFGACTRPIVPCYVQTEEATKYLPNLKCVVNYGVGVDHLKVKYLRNKGVKIGNTPGVVADCTADMALLLMLASARNFPHAYEIGMSPNTKFFSGNDLSHDVCHKTLGIVGMGDIGLRIAKRAAAFEMKINYHNRNQRPSEVEASVGATYYSTLNAMLRDSDYVILSCKMTPETNKIMSTEQFKAMKKSGTIINVGRGKLIDQEALVEALNSGEIAAAALDVTDPEPLPRDHPLFKCPNIIILPHHGTATDETRQKMEAVMIKNLAQCFNGEKMDNEVFSNE